MATFKNKETYYFKSNLSDSFKYRKFSSEPLGSLEKTFYKVKFETCQTVYDTTSIRLTSNFLSIDNHNVLYNLVKLYLKVLNSNSCSLFQENFEAKLEFSSQSDLHEFLSACDNFVIRDNIWKVYYPMRDLDKGAFSTVRLARKIDSYADLYAIKEMKKDSVDNKSYRYLEMELFALRNLRNSNAVRLFEIYEDDEKIYLITEYLNGGTLEKKIDNRDINEDTMREVISSALSVIIELNKYNIVHRDIKPANIMFTVNRSNKEICKLIDFGLCADITDHSSNSLLRDKSGTVCYLGPELIGWDIINQFYNEQVDVFSLGMILYEM